MPDTAENHLIRSRYAIFEKDGIFGMVALAITPSVNVVSRFDPREKHPTTFKGFGTEAEADRWFQEYTIATVTDNGWRLAYLGPRNFG